MKLDKDTVIKQKFWFLLGLFTLLWITGVFWLSFTAGAEIKKNKEAYDAAKKGVEDAQRKGPKNDEFVKPWSEHQMMFRKHKDFIWEKGWKLQKDMYDWHHSDAARLDEKMTDPSVPMTLTERTEYQTVLYNKQLQKLENQNLVAPIELRGGFKAIMDPISWKDTPTREEIWLAQEDYWVKRDLLQAVASILQQEAEMTRVDISKEPLPEGALSQHRFRNNYWELNLIIEQGSNKRDQLVSGRSWIKNIHPGKRILALANAKQEPLQFAVRQDGQKADDSPKLNVTGEPLVWGERAEFKKPQDLKRIDFADPKRFTVEQVFDWYSSPVKRIDQIKLGAQSSRTVTTALQPNKSLPQDGVKDEEQPPGGPAPAKPASPGSGSSGMMGGSAPGGPAGKGAATGGGAPNQTPNNGLERNRYLQWTQQCRHLPFGLVLVVDQADVPDVIAAMSNSKLRIQVTQVQIQHVRNVRPDAPAADPGRGGTGGPGTGPGGRGGPVAVGGGSGRSRRPGLEGSIDRPRPGGSNPGSGGFPGAGTPGTVPAGKDDDPNLVELSIYGIAALYEPFDPEKVNKTPPGPGAPPPPPGR